MSKWRTIKRPPAKTKGLIVIESDDGYKGDFEYWFPKFKEFSKRYSEFAPYNFIPFCPAVNYGTIGNADCMSVAQLKTMSKWTEIMNHGKNHAGLGAYPLSSATASGQNRVNFTKANEIQIYVGYEYIISEGAASERVKPIFSDNMEMPIATRTGTYILCENNLVNSYTTAATIKLSPESADLEIQSALAGLASLGIAATNHVYPYHSGTQFYINAETQQKVNANHISSRGMMVSTDAINLKGSNVGNLKAMGATLTQTAINTMITDLKANDGVFIWYWHGSITALPFLEMLITSAMSAGVRIVTRQKAVEHLKSI